MRRMRAGISLSRRGSPGQWGGGSPGRGGGEPGGAGSKGGGADRVLNHSGSPSKAMLPGHSPVRGAYC